MPASPTVQNAFSVNVEDWYQVEAFTASVPREQWESLTSRVQANLSRLLDLLENHRVQATFFVLGWIADRHPAIVQRIAAMGHEIASLGYGRVSVNTQTPGEFRDDLICSKALLEQLTGQEVCGYRAPSFSIGMKTPWAHSIIAECGFRYSSSVYPMQRGVHGLADSPRFPYRILPNMVEVPVSLIRLFGHSFPGSGGGFFRLYPYKFTRWAMNRLNQQEAAAAVFYVHLWEIDPEHPKLQNASMRTRIKHNLNLEKTLQRIESLLGEFRWGRIDDTFAEEIFGHRRSTGGEQATASGIHEGQGLLTSS